MSGNPSPDSPPPPPQEPAGAMEPHYHYPPDEVGHPVLQMQAGEPLAADWCSTRGLWDCVNDCRKWCITLLCRTLCVLRREYREVKCGGGGDMSLGWDDGDTERNQRATFFTSGVHSNPPAILTGMTR